MGEIIIDSQNELMTMKTVWEKCGKEKIVESMGNLRMFKYLEERGYGDILLARYPSFRKYFPDFLCLCVFRRIIKVWLGAFQWDNQRSCCCEPCS